MSAAVWSVFLILLVLYLQQRIAHTLYRRKHKKGECEKMEALAKEFIGQECILYTLNGQLVGVIRAVSDGALLLEKKGIKEVVNLDFLLRIREYPRTKSGKKKSCVLD